MKLFSFFPLFGFLIIVTFLVIKVKNLKNKGINVSSSTSNQKRSGYFLLPLFTLSLFLWLFEISNLIFHHSFSVLPTFLTKLEFEKEWVAIPGAIILSLSIIILTLTLIHFKSSLRFGLDEKNQGELITNGIFSISRNPFFLSLNLYFCGTAIIFPNLFFIGIAVLSIISIHLFILKEEKFMQKIYGETYKKYTKKVRRYF